jgi:TonB family protein
MQQLSSLVIFLFATLLTVSTLSAQSEDGTTVPEIILRPTIPAYFPGCSNEPEGSDEKANCSASKLMSYIGFNLQYPDEAREQKIEGVVVLSFVVSDSGLIDQVRVLRDIGGGCGQEAQRIINEMPPWQPAIFKGKQVATQFTLPITFGLRSGMFDYVLHVGELPDDQIYQKELIETLTTTDLRVTNPKGAEMVITEVVLTMERGGERDQIVLRGNARPDEKQLRKFFKRKQGRLTIDANVVEDLDIRSVQKSYLLLN